MRHLPYNAAACLIIGFVCFVLLVAVAVLYPVSWLIDKLYLKEATKA